MKFAQIGYGSDGRGAGKSGEGYTYLVNDNIRKEQILQVIAHSHKKDKDGNTIQGRAFPTTGQVLTVNKNEPKNAKGETVIIPEDKQDNLTKAYDQRQLGVSVGLSSKERVAQARFNALSIYNAQELGGLTGKEAAEKIAITGGTKTERLMSEGYESYAQYIERTKPWGDNQ